MNQTLIVGRDWSGVFSGRLNIELQFDRVMIEDAFGFKFYSLDQIVIAASDPRLLDKAVR